MNPAGGPGAPGGGYDYQQQRYQQQQQPMMTALPMMMQQQQQHPNQPFAAAPPAFPGGIPVAGQGRPGRSFDRHDPVFYKTRMCTQFQDGTCTYGDRCTFAHGADELRRPGATADDAPSSSRPATSVALSATQAAARASGLPPSRVCFRWSSTRACHFGSRCAFEHVLPPGGAVVGGGSDSISKPDAGGFASGIAESVSAFHGGGGGGGGGGGMMHPPSFPAAAPFVAPPAPAPRPPPKPAGGAAAVAASRARAACVVLGVGAAAATAAAAGGLPQGAAADVAAAARARAILAASPWADDCSSYC